MEKPKISFNRRGESGNIFDIAGRAAAELKKIGKDAEAKEMTSRMWQASSYDEALKIVKEYIDLVEEN